MNSLWFKVVNITFLVIYGVVAFVPCQDFSSHSFIEPRVYHGREKREILSSKETENGSNHIDHISLTFDFKGKDFILDLLLNRDLIPRNYFEKYQKDGGYVLRKFGPKDVELCHYNGHIRGIKNSWVALSTCDGIRGVMYDGNEMHYIEKLSTANSSLLSATHVVYSHSELRKNFTCGVQNDSPHRVPYEFSKRVKRDVDNIHGPYNANRQSRYIELVMVIDNREYNALGRDISTGNKHCKDLVNIINALYEPLNIFVALVGVVIWTDADEITLQPNGDKTLNSFLTYRKDKLVKEHPNDNAQLLTKLQFEGGVVGKALKGPICTYEYSGGVNVDHSPIVGIVATTIAHEMGHNLGMEHDHENQCECPRERCIMSPSSSSLSPTEWSQCSREYLALAFEHGMDYCLRNRPTSLFEGPVCGNGFVEEGEQCDCGLVEKCNNPCCNATTCMLYSNATCATGKCCDFKTCEPFSAGVECRSAEHECDLPEYCTGQSEYCPNDVFKIDGESCAKGTAYCYQGNCRSHTGQCRILWGPSGSSSDVQCYKMNTKGNRHGNCGFNRLNQTYIKCEEENVECGMLQCKHLNERLEFGIESAAILSHSFISSGKSIIPCRTALVDFGLNEIDPGLAPDGAKCKDNHMCLNKKCMPVDSLKALTMPNACPNDCNGKGICNSKGHCHCNKGYAPPDCRSRGVGGSQDSGPAEPYNRDGLRTVFWYMMLGLVPLLIVLLLYSYYVRRSPTYFWKRNQRRTVHCEKTVQIHLARNDIKGSNISSPVQLLLSKANGSVHVKDDSTTNSSLQDNLVGNFKGFSIVALGSEGSTSPTNTATSSPIKLVPSRPAPILNNLIPVAAVKPIRKAPAAPDILPTPDSCNQPASTNSTTKVPLRPTISSPILDNTTSTTARKMINTPSLRSAPPVPSVAIVHPSSNAPDSQTLGCVASFMSKTTSHPQVVKFEPMGLKAAKIDKDTLKNLKISDPIPLSEPSIPVESLPLTKDQERTIVMRANSLRYGAKKTKQIQSFASMRAPSGMRRPTSVASCSRPTSPPPCPPASKNEEKDDDAIYATIEESPLPTNCENSPKNSSVLGSGGLLNEIVSEIQARSKGSAYLSTNVEEENNERLYSNTYYDNDLTSKSDSSSASSSDYLRPIKPHDKNEKYVTELQKLEVPSKTAPAYRPFSMPRKPSSLTHNKSIENKLSSQEMVDEDVLPASSCSVRQRAAEMEKTLCAGTKQDENMKTSVQEKFGVKLQPTTSRSAFGKTDPKS